MNSIEVDFANRFIGGGVLRQDTLQEEIRFLMSPECLVSLLICEKMHDNEVIYIFGTRKYINCKGYAKTFEFDSINTDILTSEIDLKNMRLNNCILAMDAVDFHTIFYFFLFFIFG